MTRLVMVKRAALAKPLSIKMEEVNIVTTNGTPLPLNAEKQAAAMGSTRMGYATGYHNIWRETCMRWGSRRPSW